MLRRHMGELDRIHGSGTFSGACLPALVEHYVERVTRVLELNGAPLSAAERGRFREAFSGKLAEGHAQSAYARFIVSYSVSSQPRERPQLSVVIRPFDLAEEYRSWLEGFEQRREPFGQHADAKLLALAETLSPDARALDVGAGTGRNALPLARLGLAVDALEPIAGLAAQLQQAGEQVPQLRIMQQGVLEAALEPEGYDLIVLSEVITHFTLAELRRALGRLRAALKPQGRLLFNTFVWSAAFAPDELSRQAAHTLWSSFVTPVELETVLAAEGLSLVSDEDCATYEQQHLPPGAWPPTPWFESWAAGRNVYDGALAQAPIALRWLVCRRS